MGSTPFPRNYLSGPERFQQTTYNMQPTNDRLARSLKDLVELVQDLHYRGVGFKSLTESIDTTSSGGRLVFQIFGALAEFEHDLIRERTIAGLEGAGNYPCQTQEKQQTKSEKDINHE